MPERVEVWSVDLDAALARHGSEPAALDAHERERAARMLDPLAGARFAAAHAALREILGARTGLAPEALRFVAGPQGKPALASHPELPFNLSHADGWALVAVGERAPVGVDVERPRERLEAERLAERFFTPREARLVAERPQAFLELWTRKEALVKAVGAGLSVPLDAFEVTSDAVEYGGRTWSLTAVALPDPYVGALAAGAAEVEVAPVGYSPR